MSALLDFATSPLTELFGKMKDSALHAPTRTWAQLIEGLRANRELPDDWDGQGALATVPEVVDAAIDLARQLEANGAIPANGLTAGVNGTVYFEWVTPAGFLEIEVSAPDDIEGRWLPKGANRAEAVMLCRPA